MKKIVFGFVALCIIGVCISAHATAREVDQKMKTKQDAHDMAIATVAGGCFWCVAADMKKLPGVLKVISGYAGGRGENPTYSTYEEKGYREAVQVYYDPRQVSYEQVLTHFLKHIDPTDPGGQFADRGPGYRSAIFYSNTKEKQIAQNVLHSLENSGPFDRPMATEVIPHTGFHAAEPYHQDYDQKNPSHYRAYRTGSGRASFIEQTWGADKAKTASSAPGFRKPADAVLKKRLTPMQYEVTQQCGTEPPFVNEYADNKREGIYVDIVSGEPLFSSKDKYDSGSGWPSFTKPLEPTNIIKKTDNRYGMQRTEIRSKQGDSHLGHVFPDGPGPGGLRYCLNSAALRFIPKENLVREGYGRYLELFSPVR